MQKVTPVLQATTCSTVLSGVLNNIFVIYFRFLTYKFLRKLYSDAASIPCRMSSTLRNFSGNIQSINTQKVKEFSMESKFMINRKDGNLAVLLWS